MNHPRPLGISVPTAPAFFTHSKLVQPQAILGLPFSRYKSRSNYYIWYGFRKRIAQLLEKFFHKPYASKFKLHRRILNIFTLLLDIIGKQLNRHGLC